MAQALAAGFAQGAAEQDRTGRFPHENYAAIRRAGLPGLVAPREYGGEGADLLESALMMEALAVGDGSTALGYVMHVQTLGAAVEGRSWPQPILAHLCREAVERGALINAVATEPKLGSPSRGGLPETIATPVYADGAKAGEPTGWIINGHKNFASVSPTLDYFLIPAALEDGTQRQARFIIPAGPHIEIEETWDAMGMRSTGSHDIHIREAYVPAEMMLPPTPPKAADPSKGTANAWFTLCVNAVYVGVAQAALNFAARFAQERVPTALGKPIAELESIQGRLGQAHLLLTQARTMLYAAAQAWMDHPERRQELSPLLMAAKVTASNNAITAVEQCMRVAGGSSMTRSLPLERYYRDVQAGLYHPMSDDQFLPMFGRLLLRDS
jgi:alkylation response protein AidB-like acyl-CoA dehydrogenase